MPTLDLWLYPLRDFAHSLLGCQHKYLTSDAKLFANSHRITRTDHQRNMEINFASISWICKPLLLNDFCKHWLTYPTVAAAVGSLALCFLAVIAMIGVFASTISRFAH